MKGLLIGRDSDAEKDWGQEEYSMTDDEMAEWHHWLNGHESEQTPGEFGSSWGHKEWDMT